MDAYSPIRHKKFKVRQDLVTGEVKYDFLPEDIESPYSANIETVKSHYCLKNKEAPVIEEYELDEKSVLLVNLPD